jgi:hypothetical protein
VVVLILSSLSLLDESEGIRETIISFSKTSLSRGERGERDGDLGGDLVGVILL